MLEKQEDSPWWRRGLQLPLRASQSRWNPLVAQLGRETRGFVDGRNPSPERDFLPCA